jgi:hypothetical protein
MSLTEPTDSKWVAYFWLAVIALVCLALLGGGLFVLHSLWKGM